MLDRHVVPRLQKPLTAVASHIDAFGISADRVTVLGFVAGLASVLCLALSMPLIALFLLVINRLADGIDGELARRHGPSDAGAFLDISLDFIFYALFPIGFAIMNPVDNALPAAVLVASFVGTGATFLAFASQAEKRSIEHPEFAYKGLYYLEGLAEGSETVLCFVLMCLFPAWFPWLAWAFAAICGITAVNRVIGGYRALRAGK